MTHLDASATDIGPIDALEHYIDLVATTTTKRAAIFTALSALISTLLRHSYFVCFVRTLSIKPYSFASSAESQ